MKSPSLKITLLIIFIFNFYNIFPQSSSILIDGVFDDWDSTFASYYDAEGDGAAYDFKSFSVTNDENFLYIKLDVTPEFKLLENNNISLYIDTDNNNSTGVNINGIGADLVWNFGTRNGAIHTPVYHTIRHNNILFRALPTVTSKLYEIAIGRVNQINGTPLFISDTIKIQFRDNASGGDLMPDAGSSFTYIFQNNYSSFQKINLNRDDSSYLRIINYNVYNDGITDQARFFNYSRILNAINPDIICFNEVFNSSALQVRNVLNSMLPLPSGSWNTVKLDAGNVTASKFPILQNWFIYSGSRITASLIDLSSKYDKNILVINAHLKCCGGLANDERRQREVDAIIKFILDAKSPGGIITLPEDTPIILAGDLNLVGESQQLKTLLTGEIINTNEFGTGAPPDWDNSNLFDLISFSSDKNFAYTWRDDSNTFPPGRLDFMIFTNSVLTARKNFILQTEVMDQTRLQLYNLLQNDTKSASDHLPKTADYQLNSTVNTEIEKDNFGFKLFDNYPNPFNPSTKIKYQIPSGVSENASLHAELKIYDLLGSEVASLFSETKSPGIYEAEFNINSLNNGAYLPSGVYFYRLRYGNFVETKKMVYLR
jgi:endonuclease/exonuclease/phosphatase family metal-dependent hydrolase